PLRPRDVDMSSLTNEPRPVPPPIVLATHPGASAGKPVPTVWGAATPVERGPILVAPGQATGRNAIGAHSGAYSLYRALAVASGQLAAAHKPDLTDTAPAERIGPFPQWSVPDAIV